MLRRELFYPPLSRLVKLLFHHMDRQRAWDAAAAFVDVFQKAFHGRQGYMVIGPSPALIAKERGEYRFVVLIKTLVLTDIQKFLRAQGLHLRNDIAIDIDPITIF